MTVQPYLFFDGRCEEAIEFYRKAVGAQVEMLMRFKDSPEPPMGNPPPEKIMHANFKVADANILASDGHCAGKTNFQGFGLAVSVPTEATLERYFGALSEGGQVTMPLTKTFFSPKFGMVTDKFGVMWMLMVDRP